MRRLIYIRIVHQTVDVGRARLHPATIKKLQKIEPQLRVFWNIVERELKKLKLSHSCVRIYQDSYYGDLEPFQEMAEQGSRNSRLLFRLMRRGAHIEVTEDEFLFKKSVLTGMLYSLFRTKKLASERKEYLKKRDKFIADRITETLQDGETGILIMGAAHRVDEYLPNDIIVRSLPKSDECMAALVRRYVRIK